MGYQANYRSRTFSKGTKALAYTRATDKDGVARCQGCGAPLRPGKFEYDHIIAWEISRYSGPRNCQVLCEPCHDVKTGQCDIPTIRESDRVRAFHIGAAGPGLGRSPMPGGRRSRLSKSMRNGAVPRLTQAQKHARTIAALALTDADGMPVGLWAPPTQPEA